MLCNQLNLDKNQQITLINKSSFANHRNKTLEEINMTIRKENKEIDEINLSNQKNNNNTSLRTGANLSSSKKKINYDITSNNFDTLNENSTKDSSNTEINKFNSNLYYIKISNDTSTFSGYINKLNNKKNSFGILNYNDGDKYIGQFENDNFNGYGKYSTKKSCYMGEFVNNQIEGFGIEKWNDSDSYYIGNYIQQIKKGYGIFVLNNNLSYEGEFNDNNFNGYGTLIINKDILVKGFFTNNYIDKYNVFYENIHENKIYEGEISDIFEFEGFGILKDNNNNIYIGFWNNNELNGEGIIFNNKKIIQQGIFNNGNYCKRENTRFENINIEEIDNFFQ